MYVVRASKADPAGKVGGFVWGCVGSVVRVMGKGRASRWHVAQVPLGVRVWCMVRGSGGRGYAWHEIIPSC